MAGTIGEDEHSVGLREIIDIKHGGIEKYGISCEYLGTSVPVQKMVDAAVEHNANAILVSTIISHDDIHYKNMKKLHDYAVEKGVRDKFVIIAGGTQVKNEEAVKTAWIKASAAEPKAFMLRPSSFNVTGQRKPYENRLVGSRNRQHHNRCQCF